MSLQDVLTAPLFKRDSDNRLVMFPNGALGNGYIVPDAGMESRLRRTLMWMIISAGVLGGVGSQVMTVAFGQPGEWSLAIWGGAAAALVLLMVLYRHMAGRLGRGLAPSGMRMGVGEALMRQADAMPRWYLWAMAIGGGLLVVGSLIWMAAAQGLVERAVGLVGVLLFGAIVLQAIIGLSRARR